MTIIREIRESDAEKFLSLCKGLDHESKFMMFEPGERKTTLEEQQQRLRDMASKHNQTIFVAEQDGNLVGFLSVSGGQFARNKKSAYIVIGILQDHVGKGLGSALFQEMEDWAREHNLHRLELTVMVHNQRGVGLYQKMGFEIEGTKRDSLFVDGSYVDEYYMSKLI